MIDVSGINVMKPQSGLEFYTYTKTGMGAGENANNPWTYELQIQSHACLGTTTLLCLLLML